jgi:alpha-beta hydrolase superfamily lysophospholipase
MSANPRVETELPSIQGAAPLYIDSGGRGLFAWLHLPTAAPQLDVGLVICPPFGYESICSHRSVRAFAEECAESGIPALRFDYAGTGDSADIDPADDQLAVWSRDVVAAVSELKRRTGVSKVSVLGIRLGASLAVLASAQCTLIDGLILISPVVQGRRYLRELKTTRLAAKLRDGAENSSQGTEPSGSADRSLASGTFEVAGFALSAATLASLAKIDLMSLDKAPAPEMLILDGSTLPSARGWPEALVKLGARTTYLSLPGVTEMVMTAPQFAKVPGEMIAAARDWLLASATPMLPRSDHDPHSERVLTLPALTPDGVIVERPVFLDPASRIFGVVTEPKRGELRRRAVVLLNAGADSHIGASRMYVSLARRWARHGYIVLRMDFAGIGDSGTRPGRPVDEVFPPEGLEDIGAALDYLREVYRVNDVSLAGLCSGAYHALRAAVAGHPVQRILMVNPQNYFWTQGMSLENLQLAEVVHNPGVYRERIFSRQAWKRLVSGEVNLRRILMVYVHRFRLALDAHVREIARTLRWRLPSDLGWELEALAARGVQIVFVFAKGEPGLDLLKLQGGSIVERLGDRCRVHIVDSGDHTFSQSGPKLKMEEVLSAELFARWGPTAVSNEPESAPPR